MNVYSVVAVSLLFLLGGPQLSPGRMNPQATLAHPVDRAKDIRLILKKGLWKSQQKATSNQDIILDLVCEPTHCEREVWGYAPTFNQADHQGRVERLQVDDLWRLQVRLNIRPDPWLPLRGEATYRIELQRDQNQLIGRYSGTFNQQEIQGEVVGSIRPRWPQQLPNHVPVRPREHPRLIFRQHHLSGLRKKAKTREGKAMLLQLNQALAQPIHYGGYGPNGGYHAAGHCFLWQLNHDQTAAETAWQIVEKSMNHPGPRLLEMSPIVAGMALAYDLCYSAWDEVRLKKITRWLAQEASILIEGTAGGGWNPTAWSNWNARARSAAGLAALAMMNEPDGFFAEPTDVEMLFKIAERNLKRYLRLALGEHGFGTEGDLYTRESVQAIIPFIQGDRHVLGRDWVTESRVQWLLPHYVMRMVGKGGNVSVPTYGRHRLGPGRDLFGLGLGLVPEPYLPGVMWFFQRQFGWRGDKSFGVGGHAPIEAAYALVGYRDDVVPRNPAKIWGRVLVDHQKGFYVFRDRWRNENDFVSSIYLKRQPQIGGWSFPEAGSFRIWGLGGRWAKAGPDDGKRASENVVITGTEPSAVGHNPTGGTEPIFFQSHEDGSGVVSLQGDHWVRSFAVDYSGLSGASGLFVVVDKFTGESGTKTWVMHTEGKVEIEGQRFTIKAASGATMQGTFVIPTQVQISWQAGDDGGTIRATGGEAFFVVMSVQQGSAPALKITGAGLSSQVQVGRQRIAFTGDRLAIRFR